MFGRFPTFFWTMLGLMVVMLVLTIPWRLLWDVAGNKKRLKLWWGKLIYGRSPGAKLIGLGTIIMATVGFCSLLVPRGDFQIFLGTVSLFSFSISAVLALAWFAIETIFPPGPPVPLKERKFHYQFRLSHFAGMFFVVCVVFSAFKFVGNNWQNGAQVLVIGSGLTVAVILMLAVGFTLLLGIDTLTFGRGTGRRANRVHELRERRQQAKKEGQH